MCKSSRSDNSFRYLGQKERCFTSGGGGFFSTRGGFGEVKVKIVLDILDKKRGGRGGGGDGLPSFLSSGLRPPSSTFHQRSLKLSLGIL